MEDIKKLKNDFEKIVKKYELNNQKKTNKIVQYLTDQNKTTITNEEFAKIFNMDEKDAIIFLKFIEKGIQFKEKHIDNK
jgi:hypothetical protein